MYGEILSVLIIYIIALPVGYPFARWLLKNELYSQPFILNLILYIALGLTVLVPIYYIVTIKSLTVFFTIIIVILFYLISVNIIRKNNIRLMLKQLISINNIVIIILFSLIFFYFINTIDYMKWPPPGDIIWLHGPLVSLIEFNQKVPLTLAPLYPEKYIYYPIGMHVLIANLNLIIKDYPAKAVFIFGGAVIILIPFLLYRFIFAITRSTILCFISFLWVFYIHTWHLERWLIGYFYNGPYANLFGFMIVFVYINLIINFKKSYFGRFLIGSFIIFISLLLSYPSLAIIIFVHSLILSIIYSEQIKKIFNYYIFNYYIKQIFLLGILSFIMISILMLKYNLIKYFWYIIGKFTTGLLINEERYGYEIPISYFSNLNGIGILFTLILSIFLYNKQIREILIFYIIIMIIVISSFIKDIYQFSWFFLPDRLIIIPSLLWLPIILIYLNNSELKRNYIRIIRDKKYKLIVRTILIFAIMSVYLNIFFPYFSGELNKKYGWFSNSQYFLADFEALEWIDKNVHQNELILDDMSYSSHYLISLSLKNVTYNLWTTRAYTKRAKDLLIIWKDPRNKDEIFNMLKKYNVKYILLTSEPNYYADAILGGDKKYKQKLYKPSTYAQIFDNYNFLRVVFSKGNTRIYMVVMEELSTNSTNFNFVSNTSM